MQKILKKIYVKTTVETGKLVNVILKQMTKTRQRNSLMMYKKIEEIKDEKAALEDDLCDNEYAYTTNTELFQSSTLTFVSSEDDYHCDDNYGDWSKKDKSC